MTCCIFRFLESFPPQLYSDKKRLDMMFLRKARIPSSMSAVQAVSFPRLRMLSSQKPAGVLPQSLILELELFKAKQELEGSIFNNNLQRAEIQLKSEEIKLMTEEIKLKKLDFLANQKYNLISKENALKLLGIQIEQPSQSIATDLNFGASCNNVSHDISVVQMCQYLEKMTSRMPVEEIGKLQQLVCANKESLLQFKEYNGCKYIVDNMKHLMKMDISDHEMEKQFCTEIAKYLDIINEIQSAELRLLDVEDRLFLNSLNQHGYYKDVLHKFLNDDKYNIAIGGDIVHKLQQFSLLGYKNNNPQFFGNEFILSLLDCTNSNDDIISCDILNVLLDVNKSILLTGDTELYERILEQFGNMLYYRFKERAPCIKNTAEYTQNEAIDIRCIKQFTQFITDSKTLTNREYLLLLSKIGLEDCLSNCFFVLTCDAPEVENCAMFLVDFLESIKEQDINISQDTHSDLKRSLRYFLAQQTVDINGEAKKRVEKYLSSV